MNTIRNFRSLSGIKTPLGTLRENTLFRGGPLNNIQESDKQLLLDTYNVKTIIDFRNTHEVNNEPNESIHNTIYKNVLIMQEEGATSADPKDIAKAHTEAKDDSFMYDIYRDFVRTELAQQGYRDFLLSIANQEEGATYFHCTAGKDRTGFAATLILMILGADMDTIMDEFLKTNTLILQHKNELLESIIKFYPFDTTNEALVMDVIGVKADYLRAIFDEIETQYRTFDNYIKKALQLDKDTLDKIRKNLLK
jgi:protein-tyrosine phosphatase